MSAIVPNEGIEVSQELVECLEQTLAEMESQQLATQQLLSDTLDELESLYCELEAKSEELRELQAEDLEFEAPAPPGPQTESQAMRLVENERDELASQLRQLQSELEQLTAAAQEPTTAPTPSTDDLQTLQQLATPGAANVHAPFAELREDLQAADDQPE